MYRDDYYQYPAPSIPRQTKGGIKSQAQRGAFSKNWWAKRWLDALESMLGGGRLQRGRTYARKGQVLDIHIGSGRITAKVQGSRLKPYSCKIELPLLTDHQWQSVKEKLSESPYNIAKLLAGEMPENIEDTFSAAGANLLPKSSHELATDCTCPDWSNPCKHLAAVFYIVGEEFDRDPFLMFALRGMQREELLQQLQGDISDEQSEAEVAEPLPAEPSLFWATGPVPVIKTPTVQPQSTVALLERLGPFPLWRYTTPIRVALAPVYARAKDHADESATTSQANNAVDD